jgi:hypothetical protein
LRRDGHSESKQLLNFGHGVFPQKPICWKFGLQPMHYWGAGPSRKKLRLLGSCPWRGYWDTLSSPNPLFSSWLPWGGQVYSTWYCLATGTSDYGLKVLKLWASFLKSWPFYVFC